MGSALYEIYLIASRLLIPELEADALAQLKKLFSTAHAAMTPKLVYRIFDKTTENSPLRKLLVASLMRLFCSEASEHRLRPFFRPLDPHGPYVEWSAIQPIPDRHRQRNNCPLGVDAHSIGLSYVARR